MNQKFIDFQISLHGKEKAQKWIREIPLIIEELKSKWGLEIGKEFELSYNYVISAKRNDNSRAVLKIYFPDDPECLNQLKTLQTFSGESAIKVLESDNNNFALLLERCIPGNTLSSLNDDKAETLIFCDVVKKLWKKPHDDYPFENISKELKDFSWYFENFEKCKDLLDKDIVKKAQQIFENLVRTQKELYVLHSDLHHENILKSERGWLAIDPKGVLGEKEYEITAFMRNPIKRAKENLLTKEILIKRLDIISENLNLDKARMLGWAFAQTVLSVIWSFQSNTGRDDYWYKIAVELEKLL